MDDSIRTAKYYAPNYTALPTRQCLVCGTLESYSVSTTIVDESLPWLCDRCRGALLKLIKDFNATSNASNALEQENKEDKNDTKTPTKCTECPNHKTGEWLDKGSMTVKCSSCGCKSPKEFNYCPHCGSDNRDQRLIWKSIL